MKFADITGHQQAIQRLREMVDRHRVPHAIMLSGPEGIGKMRLARAFVQYLHCSNPINGDSCGNCPSCLQHQKFNNPDLHFEYPILKTTKLKQPISDDYAEEWHQMLNEDEYMGWENWLSIINAENKQPLIYVSQADKISATALMTPYQERQKVFLVWLPEKLQPAAANKLLKLIEEPYEDTIFVLVSNNARDILPTIYSRVQRINMLLLDDRIIAGELQKKGIDEYTATQLARLSEGHLGRALQLADVHEESEEFGNLFRDMMRSAYARRIAHLSDLAEDCAAYGREKLHRMLDYCARMVRENFIYNLKMPQLNLQNDEEELFSRKFSPFIHEANVDDMLDAFSEAENDIMRNANAKIVLFSLFLQLCMLIRTRKP